MSWEDELVPTEDEPDRSKLIPGEPVETVTLSEALPEIREEDMDRGLWHTQMAVAVDMEADGHADCPCCGQRAGLHKRSIYRRIAKWLVWLVEEYEEAPSWKQWNAYGSPLQNGGDVAKLALWGLVESLKDNSGQWRPTLLGISFVRGASRVPAYCLVYNKRVLAWSTTTITVQEALQEGFNLDKTLDSEVE